MLTRKQSEAVNRIRASKLQKVKRTMKFYKKLAERRGIKLVEFPCGEGYKCKVREVQKLGQFWIFRVEGCGICQTNRRPLSSDDAEFECVLTDNWHLSAKPISPGDIIDFNILHYELKEYFGIADEDEILL